MKVSVYKNLNKGLFSIRACGGPAKGRVIAHAANVALVGVGFHVGKLGQHEVRRTGHKNVHAFVTGTLIGWGGPKSAAHGMGLEVLEGSLCGDWNGDASCLARGAQERGDRFTYNPYKHDGFVSVTTSTVISYATRASLSVANGNHAEQLRAA